MATRWCTTPRGGHLGLFAVKQPPLLLRGVARYLRDKCYDYDIVESPLFQTSNCVLAAKRKQLKAAGLGNKPNKAKPLSDTHIEQLWATKTMGHHSAKALLNTLWFQLTEGFGLRAEHEAHQMCWGDVQIQTETRAVDP